MKSIYDLQYRAMVQKLVDRRKAAGLTQQRLGQLMGLDQSIISKIETNLRRLDVIKTIRLCEAIGCELGDVLP
jgi:transcriptional regulator with XRE-family HTH domain